MTTEQMIVSSLLILFEDVLPGKVYEWRDSPLDDAEIEAINIRDHLNEISEDNEHQHTLSVEITYEKWGETSPADIREKTQEIVTAFRDIEDASFVAGARLVTIEKEVEKVDRRFAKVTINTEIFYFKEIWEL